jgi:hypothetical protein
MRYSHMRVSAKWHLTPANQGAFFVGEIVYNRCMENTKIGAPTKYTQALQQQADEYIYKFKEVGDVIPSRVGLCCYLGVSRRVSYEWEKLYPEFLHTLENIDAMQERTAVNRGLDGTFNAAITKLILHNHGYSEKSELSHTSPDGSMTPNPTRIELVAPVVDPKH